MDLSGKKKQFIPFAIYWLAVGLYFLISSSSNLGVLGVNLIFFVMGLASLVLLGLIKSDEPYYKPLNLLGLAFAVGAGLLMIGIATVFGVFFKFDVLQNSILPLSFSDSLTRGTDVLAIPAQSVAAFPSSLSTFLLSDVIFTCVMVAAPEELWKFVGFAEGKVRMMKYGFAAVVVIVVPAVVGAWSVYHGIEAYKSAWMILSAFVNGLILIALLWKYGWLAPIIAHGAIYNTYTIIVTYSRGSANLPGGTPLFPAVWNWADWIVVGLAVAGILLVLVPIFLQRIKNG